MNHQSYSPVVKHFAWLWWSPTASEALSYRLNLYRSMPSDLPRTLCINAIIRSRKKFGALRAPHGHTNPTLYLCPGPPLLQPLGPPLLSMKLAGQPLLFMSSLASMLYLRRHRLNFVASIAIGPNYVQPECNLGARLCFWPLIAVSL